MRAQGCDHWAFVLPVRASMLVRLVFLLIGDSVALITIGQQYSMGEPAQVEPTQPPLSAVYADSEDKYPNGAVQSVEFLRFVTAYRTPLEAFVDITPYSSLLRAAAESRGNFTMYTFIDTWVGNSSGREVMYMSNVTKECSNLTISDGNGFQLDVELAFWPSPAATAKTVDTKPRASVTLASGSLGSIYPIGQVAVHEGRLLDNASTVLLDEAADLSSAPDALVYRCNGSSEVLERAFYGYIATRSAELKKFRTHGVAKEFEDQMLDYMLMGGLAVLTVKDVYPSKGRVRCSYNATEMYLERDMPIFYHPNDVMTDVYWDSEGLWWNSSMPLRPIGRVLEVFNSSFMLELETRCLPRGVDFGLPRLLAPVSPMVRPSARARVESAAGVLRPRMDGEAHLNGNGWLFKLSQNVDAATPLLLRPQTRKSTSSTKPGGISVSMAVVPPIGQLRVAPSSPGVLTQRAQMVQLQNARPVIGERVCVVEGQHSGRIMTRDFRLALKPGDHVVAQLVVTGHGWASTTEQCGEYCHAIYALRLNGESAANVTQFRDDCKDNPIGEFEHGTWWESRNGWCPGSVEPGLFFDITKFVSDGHNRAALDLSVWSNSTGRYQPYTDLAGFAMGDHATLGVGFTLFVYSAEAVAAVRAQPKPFTAAEAALQNGASDPSRLTIPKRVVQPITQVLMQVDAELPHKKAPTPKPSETPSLDTGAECIRGRGGDGNATTCGRFDFEARAPWYFWNSSARGSPSAAAGASSVVQVFRQRLVQSNTRTVQATVPWKELPADWSRVALRLRLSAPKNLDIDHWDRLAGVGLVLKRPAAESSGLALHPAAKPPEVQRYDFSKAVLFRSLHSV